jgi:hypothetical protein
MKSSAAILRFSLGAIILFAMLLQSFHSFGHLAKQFSEKHCAHKYASGTNEISHSHHDFERCFSCEFTFSHFVSTDVFSLQRHISIPDSGYTATRSREILSYFRGSLFSYRGPPAFIV